MEINFENRDITNRYYYSIINGRVHSANHYCLNNRRGRTQNPCPGTWWAAVTDENLGKPSSRLLADQVEKRKTEVVRRHFQTFGRVVKPLSIFVRRDPTDSPTAETTSDLVDDDLSTGVKSVFTG